MAQAPISRDLDHHPDPGRQKICKSHLVVKKVQSRALVLVTDKVQFTCSSLTRYQSSSVNLNSPCRWQHPGKRLSNLTMVYLPFFSSKPADPRRYYRERRRRKKHKRVNRLPLVYTTILIFLLIRYFKTAPVQIPSPHHPHPAQNPHTSSSVTHPIHNSNTHPPPTKPHHKIPHITRDSTPNTRHPFRGIQQAEARTRTCYHSAHTGSSLCVHVPFCIRHEAIAYLSDTLRCGAYTNKQGTMGSLSITRCVELERDLENAAEIEHVEHKPASWLQQLESTNSVLWFEGDTIILRMSSRARSVTHFADRIFMLHHVLQHPQRYGMGAISNIVIAADATVSKKIRYTKSWHHGLLSAMVYPNKLIYNLREIREQVTKQPRPGEIRVFIPGGLWDVAKGKLVPCFRRAALPGAVRTQYFLGEDIYPGVTDARAIVSTTRFHDADVFRTLLFQSLGHEGPPRIKRHILYLHRASTRTLTDRGLTILQEKLRAIASANSFSFEQIDVSGMTFPQQIEAVAGAGVVIGVHGTQMLNTLFLPSSSAIVEIFPFGFTNKLFENGSGAGLHYSSHQILHGDDFASLSHFKGLEECLRESKECRRWYQSDDRKLDFGILDAAAVGKLVQDAVDHVVKSITTTA